MFETMTDEEILKTIQKLQKENPADEGIRGYFDELYRRYYQRAYNLARFYGLDRYDAEDIVQDAFLKLLLHAHQFRSEEVFQVWFMRIVFNTIRDKYREKKRHIYQDIDEMSETLEGKKQNFLEIFHFRDEVERIINRIPEKIRMVLILRVYGEMEFAEIAKILHISVRQVHNRLKKAIELLKEYGKEG